MDHLFGPAVVTLLAQVCVQLDCVFVSPRGFSSMQGKALAFFTTSLEAHAIVHCQSAFRDCFKVVLSTLKFNMIVLLTCSG